MIIMTSGKDRRMYMYLYLNASRTLSLSKRNRYRTITFNKTSSGSINHIIRELQSTISFRVFIKKKIKMKRSDEDI